MEHTRPLDAIKRPNLKMGIEEEVSVKDTEKH
jgi:hypothetical protein